MLHGVLEINGYALGNWEAENIGLVDGSNPKYKKHTYRCNVNYTDRKGYPRNSGPFLVHHYDGEGAIVLASIVLAAADRIFVTQDAQREKAVRDAERGR